MNIILKRCYRLTSVKGYFINSEGKRCCIRSFRPRAHFTWNFFAVSPFIRGYNREHTHKWTEDRHGENMIQDVYSVQKGIKCKNFRKNCLLWIIYQTSVPLRLILSGRWKQPQSLMCSVRLSAQDQDLIISLAPDKRLCPRSYGFIIHFFNNNNNNSWLISLSPSYDFMIWLWWAVTDRSLRRASIVFKWSSCKNKWPNNLYIFVQRNCMTFRLIYSLRTWQSKNQQEHFFFLGPAVKWLSSSARYGSPEGQMRIVFFFCYQLEKGEKLFRVWSDLLLLFFYRNHFCFLLSSLWPQEADLPKSVFPFENQSILVFLVLFFIHQFSSCKHRRENNVDIFRYLTLYWKLHNQIQGHNSTTKLHSYKSPDSF